MDIGMLWYCENNKLTLEEKVQRAAAYYRDKYGQAPNLCYVHPSMAKDGAQASIEVRTSRSIQTNHLWLGVNREA
jgi:hypothetical protein